MTWQYFYACAPCCNIATAGRVLPSRNSRKAPPPFERYPTLSAIRYLAMAARVSPPPAMEKPSDSATACDTTLVPSAKASNSNTTTGPFHTIVPAFFSIPATRSEEHTSELQSLTRISYAVLFLQKKKSRLHYL